MSMGKAQKKMIKASESWIRGGVAWCLGKQERE
jgi:hypothetical protein